MLILCALTCTYRYSCVLSTTKKFIIIPQLSRFRDHARLCFSLESAVCKDIAAE